MSGEGWDVRTKGREGKGREGVEFGGCVVSEGAGLGCAASSSADSSASSMASPAFSPCFSSCSSPPFSPPLLPPILSSTLTIPFPSSHFCRPPLFLPISPSPSRLPKIRSLPPSSDSLLLSLPNIAGLDVQGPQSVAEALGVLAAIIAVHECGHFFAAYAQNIHVTQFSIGFGPVLFKLQGKKVEYSLRAIPLGGFVGFPDDDPDSEFLPDDPDLLKNRPILDRLLVTSAGVIANLLFAYFVLFGQTLTSGLLQQELMPGVVVPDVIPTSVAAKSGILAGDVIVSVNGHALPTGDTAVYDLVREIKASPGKPLSFLVSRKAAPLELRIVPDTSSIDGSGKIGVQLAPNSRAVKMRAKNLAEATIAASKEFSRLFLTVTDGLKQLVFNFSQTADKVSGPVAIVAVGAEVARTDAAGLSQFAAIVNINLAVVNILPLPALDGGYIFLIALEALRGGKKLPNKVEQGIMSSGILLLIGIGTFLIVRDALNLGIAELL